MQRTVADMEPQRGDQGPDPRKSRTIVCVPVPHGLEHATVVLLQYHCPNAHCVSASVVLAMLARLLPVPSVSVYWFPHTYLGHVTLVGHVRSCIITLLVQLDDVVSRRGGRDRRTRVWVPVPHTASHGDHALQ